MIQLKGQIEGKIGETRRPEKGVKERTWKRVAKFEC